MAVVQPPDLRTTRLEMEYEEVLFDTLYVRQNGNKKKNKLCQLSNDGFGFICLRHSVQLTVEVKNDMELLLRKSDIKVFRNEELGDQDPGRLQLPTSFPNTMSDLQKVNNNIKYFPEVLNTERIEAVADVIHNLHDFIQDQFFFIQSGNAINKADTICSLLGSFPPSLDQLCHWDYVPEEIQKLTKNGINPPCFLLGAFEDDTYIWLIPNSHKATSKPGKHKLMQPMLVKMMKGDIIVCNALMLHAGSGYTTNINLRFHMYLFNRSIHLYTLYAVVSRTQKTLKESTAVGTETSSRFIEFYDNPDDEDPYVLNTTKITTTRIEVQLIQKRQEQIALNRKKRKRTNLSPGLYKKSTASTL